VNRGGEQATVTVIEKIDLRPGFQCSLDAGAESPVRQKSFGDIGNQNGIADNRVAGPYFFDGQVVGKMTGTDDLDPVVEDEKANGGTDKAIPMHQCIDLLPSKHRSI